MNQNYLPKSKWSLLLLLVLSVSFSWAQSPEKISYQAVLRDAYGVLLSNHQISTRITILQGNQDVNVYSEIQYATTNINGLVTYEIGNGIVASGNFSEINWANSPTYIRMETDPNGGTDYTISGTTEFLSVPYALYASNSEIVIQGGTNVAVSGSGSTSDPYIINATGSRSDDDITGAGLDTSNTLTIREGTSNVSVDLSPLDNSEAVSEVQSDLRSFERATIFAIAQREDADNKDTDPTLSANSDTAYPSQRAVKTYIDNQIGNIVSDDDISNASIDAFNTLTINEGSSSVTVDLSGLDDSTAITAVQADVNANELAASSAISAVQADVDANEASTNAAIATLQAKVDTNEAAVNGAISAVQADVDSNEAAANTAIAAVQANVDTNEAAANTAIAAVQSDIDTNETAVNTALALKEDTSNKDTDVTLAANSDTAYPSQRAIKTYVDTQISGVAADDDITGVNLDASNILTISEGSTSVTADLSDLDDSTAIAIVQSDVDANEAAANTAIAAVQAKVDTNEAAANTAIAAVQSDVDANETAVNTALALKEDASNKDTDVTLSANSDTAYPSQRAIKTYVDTQISGVAADDDITGANLDASHILTISEGSTSVTADLSDLDDSAAIAIVQSDVDANEAAANTAILALQVDVDANEAAANTGIAAVQSDVDANEAAANTAILALQADVDTNELATNTAIAAVQSDVDANETAVNTALALKEDAANKDTDITLSANSDTAYPSQRAIKTYVDTQIGSIATDDDITGVNLNSSNILTISEGSTSVTADLSDLDDSTAIATVQSDVDTNEAAANTAILALQADVDTNELATNTAIAAVQSDIDGNETAVNTALALKENATNKDTDITLSANSDTAYPSQRAIKTYVDTQIGSIATDDDITGVNLNSSNILTISEGSTSVTADLSDLDDSAAIAIVQSDVDTNELAANTAIAAVQSDVDANETAVNTALALKEDTSNKDTDVTLSSNSDTAYPSQRAIKTYVDTQISGVAADDDITGANLDASHILTISEGSTSVTADLSDLDDSTAIAAVQSDVDANETATNTAIAAVQSDVDANEAAANTAILALQADVDANELAANTAIAAVQSNVDANETAVNIALALKEDTSNKDTDITLSSNSDTAYPSQRAIKTYVDTQIGSIATDDDITGANLDASNILTISEGSTSVTADLSDLDDSTAIAIVQSDVDANEAAANTAIAAVQSDVDANETAVNTALALKEDTSNKDTDVTLSSNSDTAYPSQRAIKTYVDTQISAIATPSATTTFEGTIQLTGDLTGTASSPTLAADAVETAVIQNDAVTPAKIEAGATNQVLQTNSSGEVEWATVSGVSTPTTGIAKFYNNTEQTINDQNGAQIDETVDLNATEVNIISSSVSLSGNIITLQPGVYELVGSLGGLRSKNIFSAPEAYCGFYNVDTSSYIGQGGYSSSSAGNDPNGSPNNAANATIVVTTPTQIEFKIDNAYGVRRVSYEGMYFENALGRAWVKVIKYQ